jgi:hypothetical protein
LRPRGGIFAGLLRSLGLVGRAVLAHATSGIDDEQSTLDSRITNDLE